MIEVPGSVAGSSGLKVVDNSGDKGSGGRGIDLAVAAGGNNDGGNARNDRNQADGVFANSVVKAADDNRDMNNEDNGQGKVAAAVVVPPAGDCPCRN
jgi:hypothetical protein